MSKWVEDVAIPSNDGQVVNQFLRKNIFSSYSAPRDIISEGGKHYCNRQFAASLAYYGIKHHISTLYHQQTSGQVEVFNKELKKILEAVVNVKEVR